MKKVASLVAAGAMLFAMSGVAFAYHGHHRSSGSVSQYSFTHSETLALSGTGDNVQSGSGYQAMTTGGSRSEAGSLTAGNVNLGDTSRVRQGAFTGSETVADSYTGNNVQAATSGHHHHSGSTTQSMVTGGSAAYAGSITLSNVNVSFD